MSCITVIGRRRYYEEGCDDTLPRSTPEWTTSKKRRLLSMARHDKPAIRAVAAAHPRLSEVMMEVLIADRDLSVRSALIKNPCLPTRLLEEAAHDEDAGIRAYARLMLEDNE